MDKLLEIKNLNIQYKVKGGYLSAVRNVNFTVNKGEIVAVVGESGCGKSTIARAIMQLNDEGEKINGEIIYKGRDLTKLSFQQMVAVRGKEIGMIFQNPLDSLNPVYRTGKQVEEAILIDNKDKKRAAKLVEELYGAVRMPNVGESMKSFPHELSGGMRQRIMIAMMLARNPDFLIADEPTTALDVTIEAQIMDILYHLKETRDTSILLITHNFGLVAEVADRIVVMYAGQLVEQGTAYEIFDHPRHPYTYFLMQALPRKSKREGRLRTIDGTVPRLTNVEEGCRFANRCPYAGDICFQQDPPGIHLSGEHSFYCHLGKEEPVWM